MKRLFTIAFVSITLISFCQKPPLKFGDVSDKEVSMTIYPPDSSAAAVVLYDYGTSAITYNQSDDWFKLGFERITRIKILTKMAMNMRTLKFRSTTVPLQKKN